MGGDGSLAESQSAIVRWNLAMDQDFEIIPPQ
jgi:hypothetical protein